MNKVGKTLTISMLINFLVSGMKIITGILCKSKSILADGFHSLSDFITDIVALYGSKISKKRADKKHPDGYGKIEYVTDLFIALVIIILGSYSIYHAFSKEPTTTNIIWIIIVILTIILKIINSKILMKKGLEYQSPILITSSRESHDDVISSLGVIVIIILSQFQDTFPILRYADTVGSIIIGLIVLHTGLDLLKENMISLLGEIENNTEAELKIKKIIDLYPEISYKGMELERHGSYYTLELEVYVLKNIRVYKLLTIENELKKKIKNLSYRIRFVDINLFHKETEKATKE